MAVVRKSARAFNSSTTKKEDKKGDGYTYKNDSISTQVFKASSVKRATKSIKLDEDEVTLNVNRYAFVKGCRMSKDGNYVLLTLDIYETSEPVEQTFTYNIHNQSRNYLLQIANKFSTYRFTGDLKELIGCAAIVKLTRNEGYMNLKVVKQITIEELDCKLACLIEEENDDDTEECINSDERTDEEDDNE